VTTGAARTLTPSERDWLTVRSYLTEHRHELAVAAAGDHLPAAAVAGTPLLAAPSWRPAAPIPLRELHLELAEASPVAGFDAASPLLPWRADGTRYGRYSEAMAELAAPLVFQNRVTYRLTGAQLAGPELAGPPRLTFAPGRYFDGVDIGEAAAHEYAAARLGSPAAAAGPGSLRGRFADPCDLRRRPANLAVSVLTLRLDRRAARASFLLHWRDPARVGHAGGLYQVVPVGVFQPSGEAAWNRRNDFSLWRCMIREFAEELGGRSEDYGSESAPVDYDSWPLARQLTGALDRGQMRVWCLGLGTDPLTYATDLLTVAVIDSEVFDAAFGVGLRRNAEGAILAAREFAAHVIDRTVSSEPVQAAGAALLRLAWQHRDTLGG
jgi:hypothetical protein